MKTLEALRSPSVPIEAAASHTARAPADREAILQALLDDPFIDETHPHSPGNYEFARDSGLIEAFANNRETGDAIVHILAGDVMTDPQTGALRIGGFHHEPSAGPDTYVDTERLAARKDKREFRRFPFEPYQAYVVVGGHEKHTMHRNREGQLERVTSHSVMFPPEYDALTVLQIIKNARDNRDMSQDKIGDYDRIIADVDAPLLDGKTTMKMRLVLESETGKIIAAMPRPKKHSLMKLSDKAIRQHLGLENL